MFQDARLNQSPFDSRNRYALRLVGHLELVSKMCIRIRLLESIPDVPKGWACDTTSISMVFFLVVHNRKIVVHRVESSWTIDRLATARIPVKMRHRGVSCMFNLLMKLEKALIAGSIAYLRQFIQLLVGHQFMASVLVIQCPPIVPGCHSEQTPMTVSKQVEKICAPKPTPVIISAPKPVPLAPYRPKNALHCEVFWRKQ